MLVKLLYLDLCVHPPAKHQTEWPLLLPTLFMFKLHDGAVLVQRGRMETLKLKTCHCLYSESHIWACCVKRMRKAQNEPNFGRFAEFLCNMSKLGKFEYETSAAR